MDDAKVKFTDFPRPELFVQNPQGRGVFGGDHDAAGVAVNPVDQRRGKAVFPGGIVFSLLIEVPLDARNQGIPVFLVVRVDQQPDLFIQQKDVFVLINDIQLPGSAQKVVSGGFLRQEFILYIQGHDIPLRQAGGNLAALSVELDILGADAFIHHGNRQVPEFFGQEFIQPLPGVIRLDGDGFHKIPPDFCNSIRDNQRR